MELKTKGINYKWAFFSFSAMIKLLAKVFNSVQIFLGEQNLVLHRQNASVGLISVERKA
jgi:hypothetical protein